MKIIVLKNEIIIKDNSLSDLFSYNSRDIFTNSTSSYTSSNPDGVVVLLLIRTARMRLLDDWCPPKSTPSL